MACSLGCFLLSKVLLLIVILIEMLQFLFRIGWEMFRGWSSLKHITLNCSPLHIGILVPFEITETVSDPRMHYYNKDWDERKWVMSKNLTVIVASEASAVILLDARSRYYKMSMIRAVKQLICALILENWAVKQ